MAAFRQVCHSSSQPVNIVLERADADPAPRAQQPANATVTYRIGDARGPGPQGRGGQDSYRCPAGFAKGSIGRSLGSDESSGL